MNDGLMCKDAFVRRKALHKQGGNGGQSPRQTARKRGRVARFA